MRRTKLATKFLPENYPAQAIEGECAIATRVYWAWMGGTMILHRKGKKDIAIELEDMEVSK